MLSTEHAQHGNLNSDVLGDDLKAKLDNAERMAVILFRSNILASLDLFTDAAEYSDAVEELQGLLGRGSLLALDYHREAVFRRCLDDENYAISLTAFWSLLDIEGIPDRQEIWDRFVKRYPQDAVAALENLPDELVKELSPESITPLLSVNNRLKRERALKQLARLGTGTQLEATQEGSTPAPQASVAGSRGRAR